MLLSLAVHFGLAASEWLGHPNQHHNHNSPYESVSVNVSQPRNNAPLNKELAYYKLKGSNGHHQHLTHSFVRVACGAVLSVHHTDPHVFRLAGTKETPILLLNHGYPESSYIWRKITPDICSRVPCIVPDRPGYGLSTVCPNGTDERTNAGAILEVVTKLYGPGKTVILGGHDRGARAMQRAAVDISHGGFPEVKALGVFMADIVPIVEEYKSFSNPNSSVGYFHWAFLPRAQGGFSTNVIMAYGGGNFVDFINRAGMGVNETAIASFTADKALEVYHTFYDQLAVTNASVYDYYSGATVDYLEEVADQAAGRKISIPTHIEYSQYNLVELSGFDVKAVWSNWVDPDVPFTTEAVCCGQGHFIIELAPQETVGQLSAFMDRLGVTRQPVLT